MVSGFAHAVGGELAIAWVAARQLGLITVAQLKAAGIGRGSIARRVANRQLHQVLRGVYLVGHPVPLPGALALAGVLACGGGAVVSHRSAARAIASYEEAERVIAEASALKLTEEQQILAAAERAPNRAGVARVRAILGQPGGPRRTRSGGERALLALIRAARLPVPATDMPLLGFTADFLWPEQRLIVELDGYPAHGHRAAFERDHRRDIVHRDAGYEVLRFTGRQLERDPFYVLAVIARALDRRTRG